MICPGSTDITTSGTASLSGGALIQEKQIVLVRHGLTTWNEAKRIQVGAIHAFLSRMEHVLGGFFLVPAVIMLQDDSERRLA